LLELLDRMNPTIEELTAAAEREAKKRPEVLRLMTHPGVGRLIPFRSSMVFDDNLLTM
jgi:transposase